MKTVNRLIFILSISGILISAYLLEKYITGGHIVCGLSSDCETVRKSSYSFFVGIPLPAYGLVFYFTVFVLSFVKTIKPVKFIDYSLIIAASVGALISLYLFYLEIFVIHAICWWCAASGIISLVLFGLCLSFLKPSGTPLKQ